MEEMYTVTIEGVVVKCNAYGWISWQEVTRTFGWSILAYIDHSQAMPDGVKSDNLTIAVKTAGLGRPTINMAGAPTTGFGGKIAFIKFLRERTGCGLKDGKDIADGVWADARREIKDQTLCLIESHKTEVGRVLNR